MPSNISIVLAIAGVILVGLAIVGGGLGGDIRIPALSNRQRTMSAVIGLVFISAAYITEKERSGVQQTTVVVVTATVPQSFIPDKDRLIAQQPTATQTKPIHDDKALPTITAQQPPATQPPPTLPPSTPVPPTPVPPTLVPQPPASRDIGTSPEQRIRDYYSAINDREYTVTWASLSNHFKDLHNSPQQGGYNEYVKWWNSVARVYIGDVRLIKQTGDMATVYAELSYSMKDGRWIYDDEPYVQLIFDLNTRSWLFYDKRSRQ